MSTCNQTAQRPLKQAATQLLLRQVQWWHRLQKPSLHQPSPPFMSLSLHATEHHVETTPPANFIHARTCILSSAISRKYCAWACLTIGSSASSGARPPLVPAARRRKERRVKVNTNQSSRGTPLHSTYSHTAPLAPQSHSYTRPTATLPHSPHSHTPTLSPQPHSHTHPTATLPHSPYIHPSGLHHSCLPILSTHRPARPLTAASPALRPAPAASAA
eukprot:364478-Chlamydomonas_euryale.AAC.6